MEGDMGSESEVWDDWRDSSPTPKFASSSSTEREADELGPAPSSGSKGSTWPLANSGTKMPQYFEETMLSLQDEVTDTDNASDLRIRWKGTKDGSYKCTK